MTFLDLPVPFHLTREGRSIRARIIRLARNPTVELSAASIVFAALSFFGAWQI